MDETFAEIIERDLRLKENEGRDKVIGLAEAIERDIKPGMSLFIEEGANAAIREVIRRFRGTGPDFTLIMSVVSADALNMVHAGLVRRIITTSCTEIRPTPGPNKVVQAAYREKAVEIENWTLYTLAQRLMAGALGLSFMPTRSLLGTGMAEENADSFKAIGDPFGGGQKLGLVKALEPDIALVHAPAADRYGNTIMSQGFKTGYVPAQYTKETTP